MGNLTRACPCGKEVSDWRSCPIKGCSEEAVYCLSCGGDAKAVSQMQEHIYGEHTNSVVSRRALIAFRIKLLRTCYRDLPDGVDIGQLTGYLFMRDQSVLGEKVVLVGEILQGLRVSQEFKWYRVAGGGMWENYYALLAKEPEENVETIVPIELELG